MYKYQMPYCVTHPECAYTALSVFEEYENQSIIVYKRNLERYIDRRMLWQFLRRVVIRAQYFPLWDRSQITIDVQGKGVS